MFKRIARAFFGIAFATVMAVGAQASTVHHHYTRPAQLPIVHAQDVPCPPPNTPAEVLKNHPDIQSCWEHPGGNPAFPDESSAMAGRQATFAKFKGWTPDLVAAAIAATDKAPTAEVTISSFWFFDDLAQGGGRVDQNVLAYFIDLPDGITDATGGIVLKAKMWEFHYKGALYRIYLPLRCRNWAYKAPGPQPTVTITRVPGPSSDCYEVSFRVNTGAALLTGVAGPDIPPSFCTAQIMPGETTWEHNFQVRVCDGSCTLENPAKDLGKPLIAGLTNSFVATQAGNYILRLSRQALEELGVNPLGCEHLVDDHRSWGEYVSVERGNFVDGKSYVEFRAEDAPDSWRGKALQKTLEWRFMPFAGEPNTVR